MQEYFDAPLLISEHFDCSVDILSKPYFYNNNGIPQYLASLPESTVLLKPVIPNPLAAMGKEYVVSRVLEPKFVENGIQTELEFVGEQIEYEAFWVTRDIAAAFGMTLIESKQAVKISSPVVKVLSHCRYEYGVFAGHWSPYQGTGNRLLTVVCTDLECHDFPHIFTSADNAVPLVISVARYWPKQGKIRLADLWIPRGQALYIPPSSVYTDLDCIDLHNNRNSARACWGNLYRNRISTYTLLDIDSQAFHWYWNKKPTVHRNPI